jgi:hypothetical protein
VGERFDQFLRPPELLTGFGPVARADRAARSSRDTSNPALTMSALALRTAETLIAELTA